ncbi:MAG: hypothetical protein RL110_390, partial [Bacteroidota bacterium]
ITKAEEETIIPSTAIQEITFTAVFFFRENNMRFATKRIADVFTFSINH